MIVFEFGIGISEFYKCFCNPAKASCLGVWKSALRRIPRTGSLNEVEEQTQWVLGGKKNLKQLKFIVQ